MEEAYEAVLLRMGGAAAATPSAVLAELAPEFPALRLKVWERAGGAGGLAAGPSLPSQPDEPANCGRPARLDARLLCALNTRPPPPRDCPRPPPPLQNVKWHLTYTRKKERELEAAGAGAGAAAPPPLKWFGRLGEAFDAAVAELGGLYTARPMAIVARLETEFPEVTMQVGGKGGGGWRGRGGGRAGGGQLCRMHQCVSMGCALQEGWPSCKSLGFPCCAAASQVETPETAGQGERAARVGACWWKRAAAATPHHPAPWLRRRCYRG